MLITDFFVRNRLFFKGLSILSIGNVRILGFNSRNDENLETGINLFIILFISSITMLQKNIHFHLKDWKK